MLRLQIWYILLWSKPHPLVFKWREPHMIQFVANSLWKFPIHHQAVFSSDKMLVNMHWYLVLNEEPCRCLTGTPQLQSMWHSVWQFVLKCSPCNSSVCHTQVSRSSQVHSVISVAINQNNIPYTCIHLHQQRNYIKNHSDKIWSAHLQLSLLPLPLVLAMTTSQESYSNSLDDITTTHML